MKNSEYVQLTVDLFESSLSSGSPFITASSLAQKIGYSPHHLNRLFMSMCAQPLGRYMMMRRLSEAACAVRDARLSASDAAAAFGWQDYSSFSRAVRREYGVSPSHLSSIPSSEFHLCRRARPVLRDAPEGQHLCPELVTACEVHVTGMVFFMGPNERTFHKPWRIFSQNRDKIRGIISTHSWQFSSWTEGSGDEDDGMWIHCAVETDPSAVQDPVFFSRRVPQMTVLRFLHDGPIDSLRETYWRIWSEYLPSSEFQMTGTFEYQQYEDGNVYICLPVVPAPVKITLMKNTF